jgi:adenylosuccinate synthase
VLKDIPYGADVLAECEPVYETAPGWKTTTTRITDYDQLPAAAKDYIRRIEDLCEAPVAMVSTGPERTETIIRDGSHVSGWME